ncbi:MAG: cell envelope integrity protein TolA [Alphaproteobacteria bacterium]
MNTALQRPNNEFYASPVGMPFIVSLILHVLVFILATVGIPYIAKEMEEPEDMIMTIEVITSEDIAQTPVIDPPQDNEENAPNPPAQVKPKPVYNQSESVPDLLSPRQPEIPPEEAIPDPTQIETPPKPKPKPKPRKKPKPAPAPKEKNPEPKEVVEEDFTSLLKSLTPETPDTEESTPSDTQDSGQTSQVADFSKQLTVSELERLNRGVQPCWNVNIGGKNAGSLMVDLRVSITPDMRVRDVQILDQSKYSTNSHFRAAADAARRALLNERCRKLNLPPEKYQQWKVFTYTFDPSDMI